MKVKSTITAAEWERIAAKCGIPPAPPDHPIYREPPSVVLFSGGLIPGIVSDATGPAAAGTLAPEPSSPVRDPLAPPVRADFWDDESFEEASGYWNTHIGRVLALRRGYKAPTQDASATSADPNPPS
jgi:hypothetical protein